jgi:chaperonin cofactor prefoldin
MKSFKTYVDEDYPFQKEIGKLLHSKNYKAALKKLKELLPKRPTRSVVATLAAKVAKQFRGVDARMLASIALR